MKTLKVFLYLVFIVGILGAVGYYGFGIGTHLYDDEKISAKILKDIEEKDIDLVVDYIYIPIIPDGYSMRYGVVKEDLGDDGLLLRPAYVAISLFPNGSGSPEVNVMYSSVFSAKWTEGLELEEFSKNNVTFHYYCDDHSNILFVFFDSFYFEISSRNKLTKDEMVDIFFNLRRHDL